MRQLISFLALALLPAAASAVILFNAGAEITATGAFPASKETQQGGLILYLKGDPDGATIDLETQPFRSAQGSIEWIPLAECSVTALPAVCKVAVGQGAIRLNVTGGLGSPSIHAIAYEASAVVGEVGGAGGGSSFWSDDGLIGFGLVDAERVIEIDNVAAGRTASVIGDSGQTLAILEVLEGATEIFAVLTNVSTGLPGIRFGAGFIENQTTWSRYCPSGNPSHCFTFLVGTNEPAITQGDSLIVTYSGAGPRVADGLTIGLPSSASPPVTCSGAVNGHIYWDTGQNLICKCDSVTWTGAGGGPTCV